MSECAESLSRIADALVRIADAMERREPRAESEGPLHRWADDRAATADVVAVPMPDEIRALVDQMRTDR